MKRFLLFLVFTVGLIQANYDQKQQEEVTLIYTLLMYQCVKKELLGKREQARLLFEKGTQELQQACPENAPQIIEQAFNFITENSDFLFKKQIL